MLLDGTGDPPAARRSAAPGVRLPITGTAALRSAAPLGFVPGQAPGPPVLLGSDPAGLERLAGLSSFYRTESWLALLPVTGLRSWELAGLQRRLQHDQATLLARRRRLQHGRAVRRAEQRPVRGRRRPAPAAPGGRRRRSRRWPCS